MLWLYKKYQEMNNDMSIAFNEIVLNSMKYFPQQ